MSAELTIIFDYERRPTARELGDVLSAIGRDYEDTSHDRTLVVTKIENGSIIIVLKDFAMTAWPYVAGTVATMAGINAVLKFYEHLKQWLGKAKTPDEPSRLFGRGRKAPGQRSVEAIVKTAAGSGSHVRVRHIDVSGETLEAELTPAQAVQAVAHADARTKEHKTAELPSMSIEVEQPKIDEVIAQLSVIDDQNISTSQLNIIVGVVVGVLLTAGAGHLIRRIAGDLEAKGLGRVADAVKSHAGRGGF